MQLESTIATKVCQNAEPIRACFFTERCNSIYKPNRFCLSYRDVEELLFVRGVTVTHETIRKWCRKFGQQYANQLRRRRPRPGDKWHLDEVFLTIHGVRHYLWRAVD